MRRRRRRRCRSGGSCRARRRRARAAGGACRGRRARASRHRAPRRSRPVRSRPAADPSARCAVACAGVAAVADGRCNIGDGLVQPWRDAALFGGEVGVARGQGEAVGLAHRRRADDLERQVEVAHHLPDDAELLVVLLAEHGDVGPHLREQLAAHRGDAAEEVRARTRFPGPPRRRPGRCGWQSPSDTSGPGRATKPRRSRRSRAWRGRPPRRADSARSPRAGRTALG